MEEEAKRRAEIELQKVIAAENERKRLADLEAKLVFNNLASSFIIQAEIERLRVKAEIEAEIERKRLEEEAAKLAAILVSFH